MPEQAPAGQYPIVLANILASALISLVDELADRVQADGVIALSGILHNQADEVISHFKKYFDELTVLQQEDWVRICGRRNNTH